VFGTASNNNGFNNGGLNTNVRTLLFDANGNLNLGGLSNNNANNGGF